MKKQLLITFIILSSLAGKAQNNFKQNDIYLEAFGNGLFGSVNYERQLTKEPGIGIRLGVGFYTENAFYLTIPVGINYLFKLKRNNSFIDAGLGATWAQYNGKIFNKDAVAKENSFVNFIPSIGYRRHIKNDVMWRISLTPVTNKYALTPSLGFSIGKRF